MRQISSPGEMVESIMKSKTIKCVSVTSAKGKSCCTYYCQKAAGAGLLHERASQESKVTPAQAMPLRLGTVPQHLSRTRVVSVTGVINCPEINR